MKIQLKIFHKGLILVSVPLIFEIVFVVILVSLLRQADLEIRTEIRAMNIVYKIDGVKNLWTDAAQSVAKYRFGKNEKALERCIFLKEKIKKETEEGVQIVLSGNVSKKESRLAHALRDNTPDCLEQLQLAMDGINLAKGPPDRTSTRKLRVAAENLVDLEAQIAAKAPAERMKNRQLIQLVLEGGLSANVLLTLALTFYLSRSITTRLACVTDNTQKLSKRLALNPPVQGADEIKVLDDCLHSAAVQLRELEDFKRDMMAMVSHELRSPLSSIVMSLKLLSEGVTGQLPDRAMARVKSAETSADRLIRLINDLLDIDKIEAGMLELHFLDISIDKLLAEGVQAVEDLAQKRDISIIVECLPQSLVADYERLLQVIINLLSNAIKYSPDGGKIRIASVETAEFLEFRVTDEGRGIPENFKEKVFERFQQVNQFDPREKSGSGLGLAICKAIVEQHHGKIGVESEEGKGSTFWFRIPKNLSVQLEVHNEQTVGPAEGGIAESNC